MGKPHASLHGVAITGVHHTKQARPFEDETSETLAAAAPPARPTLFQDYGFGELVFMFRFANVTAAEAEASARLVAAGVLPTAKRSTGRIAST